MAHLDIPDSILEEFRCSVCEGYLSSAPVQVLPDGKSICTACAPSSEQPTHRQLTLESLLSKLLFPCCFNKVGCKDRIPFGRVTEHEDICSFQPSVCPSLPLGSCAWKGSVTQISEHFTNQHVNLMQEKLEFKLQVDKDEEGIVMTVFEGVPLIMKYKYNSSTSSLYHDVRFITVNKKEGLYKIQLINDLDHDYSIIMKGDICLPYSNNFSDAQDLKVLVVNKFLQNLNNPNCIIVAINTVLCKSIVEQPQLTMGYNVVESLKCTKCCSYLIPPIFNSPHGVICSYCKEKFGFKQASNIVYCVSTAKLPCCWRGCKFVEKIANIREHELNCQFRVFNCTICKKTRMWKEAVAHVRSHGYEYFTSKYVYEMPFGSRLQKNIFTLNINQIFYIKLHSSNVFFNYQGHDLQMFLCDSTPFPLARTPGVELEHTSCKIKSKLFKLSNVASLVVSELPPSIKWDDKVTVTIIL